MWMVIEEQRPLAPLTTMGVGGAARWFAEAGSESDVVEALRWAREREAPVFILGGGSNLLVPDEGYSGLVLRIAIGGVRREGCTFDAGAGESWDALVQQTVDAGCAGMECLAGIPGTVGGTPVQNVGAYGQEVAETIEAVRVVDREHLTVRWMNREDCGFRYRESVFNTTQRGRYVVVRVRFRLREQGAPTLKYADLQRYFSGSGHPTLAGVADAVREIRATKGMVVREGDPDARSAGSFFKNPVISLASFERVREASGEGEVPHWPAAGGEVKLPAAWLLEHAGFVKGSGEGRVGISSKHTLALVNRGGASFAELAAFQQCVVDTVEARFGIRLEREPVVLR